MQKKSNFREFGALVIIAVFLFFTCEIPDDLSVIPQYNNVAFVSLTADGSANLTTSKLVLTFDKDIDGLAAADITLTVGNTGAVKNVLTKTAAGKYELSLKNITAGGMVSVSAAKSGYIITGGPKQVTIYYKQGSGNGNGDDDDEIPSELVAKWYTHQELADAETQTAPYEITSDGKLLLMGLDEGGYTLTVAGNIITFLRQFDNSTETVKYSISGTVLTLTEPSSMFTPLRGGPFYKKGEPQVIEDIEVEFTSLTQDGHSTQTTTKLTLVFDNDIDGFSTDDITLDAGTTGAVKVKLTKTPDYMGRYELTVNGITEGGMISVSVLKTGYAITGGPKQVTIYGYDQIISYNYYGDFEYSYGTLTQTVTITGYSGNGGNVTIPAEIDGKPVTTIADGNGYSYGVFSNEQLTSITIPNSVIKIGAYAFYRNQLISVNIGNSVTTIGDYAFAGSNRDDQPTNDGNQLTSVIIPNSATSIGNYAFAYNQLTSVTIPNSVTSIGAYAFYRNQLISVNIGNSITSIGDSAFTNNRLTSVIIPNSVTFIGNGAFAGNQLTNVTIPNSVTKIEFAAFASNKLTNVTIGNSVTEIGQQAFAGNQLTSVTIPNSVTFIGVAAFQNNQLTSITIGANVTLASVAPGDSFYNGFDNAYNTTYSKAAGRYTRPNTSSTTWTKVN
jgi:hypothetical protein